MTIDQLLILYILIVLTGDVVIRMVYRERIGLHVYAVIIFMWSVVLALIIIEWMRRIEI